MSNPYTVTSDGRIVGPEISLEPWQIAEPSIVAAALGVAYRSGRVHQLAESLTGVEPLLDRLENATRAEDAKALGRLEADMASLPDDAEDAARIAREQDDQVRRCRAATEARMGVGNA